MNTTIRRRVAMVGVALSTATALTACGGSNIDTATKATTAAASKTAKVGDTIALSELAQDSYDAMKKAGTVKIAGDVGDGLSGTTGEVSYKGDSPAMHLKLTQDGGTGDIILLDKTMYMSGSGEAGSAIAKMSGGKKWVKISADGTDPVSKSMAPMLNEMDGLTNPSNAYRSLSNVKAKVSKVEGDKVTYVATVPAAEMTRLAQEQLKKMGGAGASASASIPAMEAMTMTQVVDKEGRTVSATTKGGVAGDRGDNTITYTDYGAPVSITAPPAAEVGTLTMPTS
ncbi:MAG: hypothetical protein LWW86_03150 [Micrococcales bacterium]|nr:hypothetical protein [Micrococcales bacterium]